MRELFGKLIDLDPAASDALRVIEYFDKLVSAHAGPTALLKEAAVLSRSTIGYARGEQRRRFRPSGAEDTPADRPTDAIVAAIGPGSTVWLETGESTVATSAMVLDRLALALATITHADDSVTQSAVAILLGPPLPDDDQARRTAALGRLRLEPNGTYRALALPVSIAPPPGWPHGLMETPWGPVRGVITRAGTTWDKPGGIGTLSHGFDLHTSWWRAVAALRLSDETTSFNADALGTLVLMLDPARDDAVLRDEEARVRTALAHNWKPAELAAVADGQSVRSIANAANLHHSTISERLTRLPIHLGYDPHTGIGRARLAVALMIHRLNEPTRFDRPTI